ncbi:uncharacterized protein JCM15063_000009 [Sporobolomyces koalae]|uniref:uncharacterized protein n=1 Tax=Sporobolomyces koalae TaxID=500713 RepID=UPI0031775876
MSGFSTRSVFSNYSTTSTTSTSSTSSTQSFAGSKIAWLSSVEVEAAIEKEKSSIRREEELSLAGTARSGRQLQRQDELEDGERKDWTNSVGPNTLSLHRSVLRGQLVAVLTRGSICASRGRKLGKMLLSSSTSVRSLRISSPLQLKPLEDPATAYNRTPPVTAPTRSVGMKWFF